LSPEQLLAAACVSRGVRAATRSFPDLPAAVAFESGKPDHDDPQQLISNLGGMPRPFTNAQGAEAPTTGLIGRQRVDPADGQLHWLDNIGRAYRLHHRRHAGRGRHEPRAANRPGDPAFWGTESGARPDVPSAPWMDPRKEI